MGTFILNGYQFVNTDLRINCSLQTQLVVQTPPRLAKPLFSSVFEQKGFFLLLATHVNNILAKSFQTLFE